MCGIEHGRGDVSHGTWVRLWESGAAARSDYTGPGTSGRCGLRILLIGNYPLEDGTSMPRYAEMLRREMSARGHEVTVLMPPPVVGRLAKRGGLGKWLGYVDKYLLFPLALRGAKRRDWDALHVCDQGNSMYLMPLRGAGVKPSITCHDMLAIFAAEGRYPGVEVSSTGKVQQRWIRRGLVDAASIVSVSEETTRDLRAAGARGQIVEIGQPLNFPFVPDTPEAVAAVRAKAGIPEAARYVLHVGGNTWYKARPGVLRLFAALRRLPEFADLRLVMAGRPWTDEMRAVAVEEQLGSSAIEICDASDADVRALYTGAEALLFPSLAEGFGWPILEAQSCGCPVVTSNRAPMAEVAGNAAILIDPADPAAAAEMVAARWHERPRLRALGFANAQRFDLAAIVDKYEAFFASRRDVR